MISIQSLIKVGDDLVPIEDFTGPVADADYIEGALELSVDHKPILIREQVDYIDQLWAYLVDGLADLAAGRPFSTSYPDMPVEITMTPHGRMVTIKVDRKKSVAEASAPLNELGRAMVAAATAFFERLAPLVPARQESYQRCLTRLAKLAKLR